MKNKKKAFSLRIISRVLEELEIIQNMIKKDCFMNDSDYLSD